MSGEEKQSSVVTVTSENLAEFQAKKLGLAPATPAAAAVKPAEPVVDKAVESAPAGDETGESVVQIDQKKPIPKIEKRFSELTKARDEARAEAQREREARQALEAKISGGVKKEEPQVQVADAAAEPDPAQFKDAFDYAKALAKWSAEEALREDRKTRSEQAAQTQRQTVVDAWSANQTAFKAETSDYVEALAASEWVCSDEIRDAIIESDVGPQLLYHLAKNPEIGEKINGLSLKNALKELGRLEAKLEKAAPPALETDQKPVAAAKPRAPSPISPITSTTALGSDTLVDDKGDFKGSYAEYRAARKAGKIK